MFAGLLHDAEEAYLPDIPSPIKKVMKEAEVIYFKLNRAIRKKYGLAETRWLHAEWETIENVDKRICTAEAKALGIWNDQWEDTGESLEVDFWWLPPADAEDMFLKQYALIRDKL